MVLNRRKKNENNYIYKYRQNNSTIKLNNNIADSLEDKI